MTLRQTYINAAKRIHNHEDTYSCCAVSSVVVKATGQSGVPVWQRVKYASVMSPREHSWLVLDDVYDAADNWSAERQEMRNFRVWLLCMMAACCNDV